MRDPNAAVRVEAVQATGHFGAQAVPRLGQALEDTEWLVRHQAIQGLRQLGPTEKTAVAALGQALDNRDWAVRHAATQVLGELGPAAAPRRAPRGPGRPRDLAAPPNRSEPVRLRGIGR